MRHNPSIRLPLSKAALNLCMLLVGCGGGGGDSGTEPNPPPGGSPHPLTVQVTLDPQRTDSTLISAAGGTVAASSADGTQFTLTVPPDAILEPQEIALTPISAIGGLPGSSKLVAGVQLSPDGLELVGAADLTVSRAGGFDASHLLGFGYMTTGSDFHLEPMSGGASGATFSVTHFSGYGIEDGEPADMAGVQPLTPENQAKEVVEGILRGARDRAARAGGSGEVTLTAEESKQVEEAMKVWYDAGVSPIAHQAETDESQLNDATALVLEWERLADLLHLTFSEQRQALMASLTKGYTNAIEKAYGQCTSSHDLFAIRKILVLGNAAVRLGAMTAELPNRRMNDCATFELDLESVTDGMASTGARFHSKANSVVPLIPKSVAADSVTGETVIDYVGQGDNPPPSGSVVLGEATLSNPNPDHCSDPAAHPSPGELEVVLGMRMNTGASSVQLIGVGLNIDPPPNENFTFVCTVGQVSIPEDIGLLWNSEFRGFHETEFDQANGNFVIRDWSMLYGQVFAEKRYDRTQQLRNGLAEEHTVIQLKHTPPTK